MEWVETTGKTIEEAKDAALDQLGVDEQEAEFEILEEPKSGLFGRVRREARVRARVQPKHPRPKADRRDRRPRHSSNTNDSKKRDGGQPKASSRKGSRSQLEGSEVTRPPSNLQRPERGEDGPRDQSEVGSRRDSKQAKTSEQRATKPTKSTTTKGSGGGRQPEGKAMSTETVPTSEQADIIEAFLKGLVDAFGIEAGVGRQEVDDELLEVLVEAPDLGLLIGPKGQTLTAIQEIARTVLQRKATGVYQGRVRIDIGGYRNRRRAALERFAQSVAEQVSASGKQKVLEPMNPADRKVVHDTINEIDGVATSSEGTEPFRRVVIRPLK